MNQKTDGLCIAGLHILMLHYADGVVLWLVDGVER